MSWVFMTDRITVSSVPSFGPFCHSSLCLWWWWCVWVFYTHISLCTMWMPRVHGSQKRASDSLELELQTVVSCPVVRAESVLWRAEPSLQTPDISKHLTSHFFPIHSFWLSWFEYKMIPKADVGWAWRCYYWREWIINKVKMLLSRWIN